MLLDNNRLQGDKILKQEYMPLTELATRWGTTRHFLWKRVKDGLIPSFQLAKNNKIFIPVEWIDKQEKGSKIN
jgi:hypothetical protein